MRRKVRIASTVVSMLLVAAIMCVGVFAATQVTMNGEGKITFTAEDVFATVTIDNQADGEGVSDGVRTWTFDATNNPGTSLTESLNFKSMAIDPATYSTTLTITVKNNLEAGGEAIAANLAVTSNNTELVTVESTPSYTIEAGAEATTITVKFNLTEKAKQQGLGADGVTFDFVLTLARAA